jgi:hypothetical protein
MEIKEGSLEDRLHEYTTTALETMSLEDLLEEYDVTPQEAFIILFNNGMIDLVLEE